MRAVGRQYFYIDYKHFCDVVKWRVAEMRRLIDKDLRNVHSSASAQVSEPDSLPFRNLTLRATYALNATPLTLHSTSID